VRKKITVLSPSAGRLPSKTAIIGVSLRLRSCDHSDPLPTLTLFSALCSRSTGKMSSSNHSFQRCACDFTAINLIAQTLIAHRVRDCVPQLLCSATFRTSFAQSLSAATYVRLLSSRSFLRSTSISLSSFHTSLRLCFHRSTDLLHSPSSRCLGLCLRGLRQGDGTKSLMVSPAPQRSSDVAMLAILIPSRCT
jgi:hypothetical protein